MANTQQFESVRGGLLVRAPAKINVSLLIAGKRPDGFHEIETVMAKVDWYDEIRIERARSADIELVCEGPCWAPRDESNLVYRAAEEILRACDRADKVRLTLIKNIPAGSGLGSASSDAAAALLGLNRWLDLGLTRSRLTEIASQLGSDVAFFLNGPLAFCTGRGEKITELPDPFVFTALLILPDVSCSTKKVYENYAHDPALYRSLNAKITAHLARNRVDFVAGMCGNMLEGCCFRLYEELGDLKRAVESLDVGPVCLSGSGSTMFCILDSEDIGRLEEVRARITDRTGCNSTVVRNNVW